LGLFPVPPWAETEAVLNAGTVPSPPAGTTTADEGESYILGVDVDEEAGLAAVLWAAFDLEPRIAPEAWWCTLTGYSRAPGGDGAWGEVGDITDNVWTPTPLTRPSAVMSSTTAWFDWHSNGGVAGWSDGEQRTGFCGIAPTTTDRLVVTDAAGRSRDLTITPWNGAYAAYVRSTNWTLTGYAADGRRLGSFSMDR
jgi:hypothetical protein